jgi:lysylphosphatidylglycerol synthetase-like protein (DUF2156 family)
MVETAVSIDFVHDEIRKHTQADNVSSFLAVNEGNRTFTSPGVPGLIIYRRTSRFLVQFGGPFAPADACDRLLADFVAFAGSQGLRVVAVQVQRSEGALYARQGFTINQIGASYALELASFTLRGTRFMRLRNKIAKATGSGLVVKEARLDEWYDAMRVLDARWLKGKGEESKELEFLVGQYGGEAQEHRRLFVGLIEGELAGYISYSPVYGSRAGWMHDLSRRIPDGVPGVMEAINRTAIETFAGEGVAWLHFGFTPFTSLRPEWEHEGHSHAFSWFMNLLWEHGEAVYPAASQLSYKEKWAPTTVIPEYVAFHGPASLSGFVHIFRAANAV